MKTGQQGDFTFEWREDFRIRCIRKDEWTDFAFDLGGGEKDLPITTNPRKTSKTTSEDFVTAARSALIRYLEGIGYNVILLPY